MLCNHLHSGLWNSRYSCWYLYKFSGQCCSFRYERVRIAPKGNTDFADRLKIKSKNFGNSTDRYVQVADD